MWWRGEEHNHQYVEMVVNLTISIVCFPKKLVQDHAVIILAL